MFPFIPFKPKNYSGSFKFDAFIKNSEWDCKSQSSPSGRTDETGTEKRATGTGGHSKRDSYSAFSKEASRKS